MRPSAILMSAAAVGLAMAGGCERRPNPPATPAPIATAPAAPDVKPAAAPDAALAAAPPEGPPEDRSRFLAFDRANLRRHKALLAFVNKARAQLDEAAASAEKSSKPATEGAPGKTPAGVARVLKLQERQKTAIARQAEALRAMDPDGARSALSGDHDTNLHYLADEYPAAIVGALSGDPGPLTEVRAEMDKLATKIEAWLTEVGQAPR